MNKRYTAGEIYWAIQPQLFMAAAWFLLILSMVFHVLSIDASPDLDGVLNLLLLFFLALVTINLPWDTRKRLERASDSTRREARKYRVGHRIEVIPDGERVAVYEVKREKRGSFPFTLSAGGFTRSRLEVFDAEHEAERCIEYVDKARERITRGRILSDRELQARALAETLNESRWSRGR